MAARAATKWATGRAPVGYLGRPCYIDEGLYDGGQFYRAVRLNNQEGEPKIQVIQGGPPLATSWGAVMVRMLWLSSGSADPEE